MNVAEAAFAAFCKGECVLVRHVDYQPSALIVVDESSARHLNDQVGRAFAVATAAAAFLTVFGEVFALVSEIGEGGEVVVDLQNDVAALAAVAAVGTARGNIFFAVKCDGTVAAVAAFDKYDSGICKHKNDPPKLKNPDILCPDFCSVKLEKQLTVLLHKR